MAAKDTSKTDELQPFTVNVRVKLSALWTAMLFVFAYVDLFSFFRPDVRADIEAGEVGGFAIGEGFLVATTVYILTPSLMVFGALALRPRLNRIVNITLAVVYALSIAAGAIGEWNYYILGSVVEIALLAAIVHYVVDLAEAGCCRVDLRAGEPRRAGSANRPVALRGESPGSTSQVRASSLVAEERDPAWVRPWRQRCFRPRSSPQQRRRHRSRFGCGAPGERAPHRRDAASESTLGHQSRQPGVEATSLLVGAGAVMSCTTGVAGPQPTTARR